MARPRKITTLYQSVRRDQKRLADWMRDNYHELLAELGAGRIDWRNTREVVKALGLTDEHDAPPSADTLSRTWRRVCRKVAEDSRPTSSGPTLLKPGEIAPGVRLVVTPEAKIQPLRKPLSSEDIRPARPRQEDALVTPAASWSPVSSCKEAPADADAQIRAALAQIGSARVPMPRAVSHFIQPTGAPKWPIQKA